MLLGLETFSYHLAFAYGKMNILNFIERTAEFGLDGVQINVEGDDLVHQARNITPLILALFHLHFVEEPFIWLRPKSGTFASFR